MSLFPKKWSVPLWLVIYIYKKIVLHYSDLACNPYRTICDKHMNAIANNGQSQRENYIFKNINS